MFRKRERAQRKVVSSSTHYTMLNIVLYGQIFAEVRKTAKGWLKHRVAFYLFRFLLFSENWLLLPLTLTYD